MFEGGRFPHCAVKRWAIETPVRFDTPTILSVRYVRAAPCPVRMDARKQQPFFSVKSNLREPAFFNWSARFCNKVGEHGLVSRDAFDSTFTNKD